MAETTRIIWEGVKELNAALMRINTAIETVGGIATAEAAAFLERAAKDVTPVGVSRTDVGHAAGTLRRSYETKGPYLISKGTWQAMVGPTAPYGKSVEFGLAPRTEWHSESGKAFFWTGSTGNQHDAEYPRDVIHKWPGFEGRHYFEHAFAVTLPEISAIYKRAWTKALKGGGI